MGTLLLIRHGQASFGADDYDRLSELGQRQCRALGHHLREGGFKAAAVLTGTLRRHAQSFEALADGHGPGLPTPTTWPELDEYDSLALLRALPPAEPLPPPDTPEGFKAHFRQLRRALAAWMEGHIDPVGMPPYREFRAGIGRALEHLCRAHVGQPVLVVSSGGPISTAVGMVLGTPAASTIDLNLRMRNSSVTELVFNAKGHQLVSFNGVPHLEGPERQSWITHA